MLISIVIPSYNHSKYICECISSVIAQTFRNFELIIVDDGSQDNSLDLIKSFNDNRIKLFCQENQGAHHAINRGLQLSSGDYITILNSDDVFYPNRIAECLKAISHENCDLVCSYINVIDAES